MIVVCPGCKRKLSLPDSVAGRKAKCPECETVFRVPKPKRAKSGQSRKSRSNTDTYGLNEAPPSRVVKPTFQPGSAPPKTPRLDRRRGKFVEPTDAGEESDSGTAWAFSQYTDKCVTDLREGGPWVMRLIWLVLLAVLTDAVVWFLLADINNAAMLRGSALQKMSAPVRSGGGVLVFFLIFNLLAAPLQLALESIALGLAMKTCSVRLPSQLAPLDLVSDVIITRLTGFCACILLGLFVPFLLVFALLGYPLLMYIFLPAWTTADKLEIPLSKSLAVSGMWLVYLIAGVVPILMIGSADLLRLYTLAGLYVVMAGPMLMFLSIFLFVIVSYLRQAFSD